MSGPKEKLAGIVGSSGVPDGESTLLEYPKDGSFAKPMKSRFVVKAKTAPEAIKGTADFFSDTQRWMNEKKLGVDMGHWNQDLRHYKVREAVNPKHLCGSYYRTLTPSKIGA